MGENSAENTAPESSAEKQLRSLKEVITTGANFVGFVGKAIDANFAKRSDEAHVAAIRRFETGGKITDWDFPDGIPEQMGSKMTPEAISKFLAFKRGLDIGDAIRTLDDGTSYLTKYVPDPTDPSRHVTIQTPPNGPDKGGYLQIVTPDYFKQAFPPTKNGATKNLDQK